MKKQKQKNKMIKKLRKKEKNSKGRELLLVKMVSPECQSTLGKKRKKKSSKMETPIMYSEILGTERTITNQTQLPGKLGLQKTTW